MEIRLKPPAAKPRGNPPIIPSKEGSMLGAIELLAGGDEFILAAIIAFAAIFVFGIKSGGKVKK